MQRVAAMDESIVAPDLVDGRVDRGLCVLEVRVGAWVCVCSYFF